MKKTLIIAFTLLSALTIKAQKDSIFKGYLYNDEYQVYIEMDFYHNNIKVPGQEIFGDFLVTLVQSVTCANGFSQVQN